MQSLDRQYYTPVGGSCTPTLPYLKNYTKDKHSDPTLSYTIDHNFQLKQSGN
jgi:hypothetical protein